MPVRKAAAVAGAVAVHGEARGAESARAAADVIGAALDVQRLHVGQRDAEGEDGGQLFGIDLRKSPASLSSERLSR